MSLTDGLIGAWCPSLGPSGYKLLDRSGRGNHGTLTNMDAGAWAGSNGWALSFDGTNDYVVIPTRQFYSLRNTNKTVAAWVKTTTPGTNYRTVFSVDKTFALTIKNSVLITYDWAAATDRSSGTNVANGQWRHLAVAIRSGVTGGSQLYVDGQAAGAAFLYSDQVGNATNDATIMTALSASNAPVAEYVNGQLDDVRLYSRCLSAAEIAILATRRGIGLTQPAQRRAYKTQAAIRSYLFLNRGQVIGGGTL